MSNLHAVVTGSSSGIGHAIASAMVANGWRVTGLDVVAPTISHATFTSVRIDLTDGDALVTAANSLGDVDALVHAAGVLRVGNVGTLDHAGGELMWRLHVDAATRLCDALLPKMTARGTGRVIFIGSRVAVGMAGRGQYAATKAALIALAKSWAAEVAPHGVTVNVVCPGPTDTALFADYKEGAGNPEKLMEAFTRSIPLGRIGQPDDLPGAIVFFASDAAGFITGQVLSVSGGLTMNG